MNSELTWVLHCTRADIPKTLSNLTTCKRCRVLKYNGRSTIHRGVIRHPFHSILGLRMLYYSPHCKKIFWLLSGQKSLIKSWFNRLLWNMKLTPKRKGLRVKDGRMSDRLCKSCKSKHTLIYYPEETVYTFCSYSKSVMMLSHFCFVLNIQG